MTKKQLALEVIERLKKESDHWNTLWQTVRLIMMRHGNCWSVSGLRHSVRMPG